MFHGVCRFTIIGLNRALHRSLNKQCNWLITNNAHTHTHTHTHAGCVCVYVCVCVFIQW